MATTSTLDTMLPEFARAFRGLVGRTSYATTTNISSGVTVVSTELRNAGFTDDDILNDFFLRGTSGNNTDVVRRIDDYTGATGTITVSGANLTAEATATNFEIYRYDPLQLRSALNDARIGVFPALHLPVNNRTLTTSLAQNHFARPSAIMPGYVRQVWVEPRVSAKTFANNICKTLDVDMETSGTADWTATQATISKESETTGPDNFVVFSGSQSLKVVAAASQTATVFMSVPSATNYDGERINVGVWVYSRTASRVSAAVRFDSGSVTTGASAHAGGGWEHLTVSLSVGDVTSSIDVGVQVSSGAAFTFYMDELIATSGPSEIAQLNGWPVQMWREEGDYIVIDQFLPGDAQLLVVGMGILESLTSGTSTMTLEPHQRKFLYRVAASEFFDGDIDVIDSTGLTDALRRSTHYRNRAEESFGQMMPVPLIRSAVP